MIHFRQLDVMGDWAWVKDRIDCVLMSDTKGIVAVRNREIIGAIVLDSWTPNSVQGHLAADTPLAWRHGLHKEAFRYVFETCNRGIFLGLTADLPQYQKAIKFHDHLGFTVAYRIKDGHAVGTDMIVFQMRREDCRYLEEKTDGELATTPLRAAHAAKRARRATPTAPGRHGAAPASGRHSAAPASGRHSTPSEA